MKRTLLGILLALTTVAATSVAQQRGDGFVPRATPAATAQGAAAGTELIVVPATVGDKTQLLTVIDPRQRALAVYQIDLTTGKITLKSARSIQWDLQVENFNNMSPTPQEIRSGLEQR